MCVANTIMHFMATQFLARQPALPLPTGRLHLVRIWTNVSLQPWHEVRVSQRCRSCNYSLDRVLIPYYSQVAFCAREGGKDDPSVNERAVSVDVDEDDAVVFRPLRGMHCHRVGKVQNVDFP